MSMKFIPLANSEPKLTDDPYLFKVRGQPGSYARPQKKARESAHNVGSERIVIQKCVPRPKPKRTLTKKSPILGLCSTPETTAVGTRAHENFVMSYVDYKNRKDDPDQYYAMDTEGPEACELPKRPKSVERPDPRLGKWNPPPDYTGPVAFFPDFEADENWDAGWMDLEGVFHSAVMGEPLPLA